MIRYRDLRAWKYELMETYQLYVGIHPEKAIHTELLDLATTGFLTIHRDYAWDGPSGPAIDTKNFMRGSLVHDALYNLVRMGLLPERYRSEADKVLRRLCREDGMSALRSAWVYHSVRTFGWGSTRSRDAEDAKQTQVQTAP